MDTITATSVGSLALTKLRVDRVKVTARTSHSGTEGGIVSVEAPPGVANFLGKSVEMSLEETLERPWKEVHPLGRFSIDEEKKYTNVYPI